MNTDILIDLNEDIFVIKSNPINYSMSETEIISSLKDSVSSQ